MKDGRFENAREMMQALLDGKKVRNLGYEPDEYLTLNLKGEMVDEDGLRWYPMLGDFDAFELYTEPKKQIEKFEWWVIRGSDVWVTNDLLTEEESKKEWPDAKLQKTGRSVFVEVERD